jgi:hypothetical protein
MAGRLLLSLPVTNGNNGHDLSVCVRQPKAVGFSSGVALDYIRGAGLRGRDRLFLGTQDTGFLLDRNGSLQPIDCEQRALLPLTIARARFVCRRYKEPGAVANQDLRTILNKKVGAIRSKLRSIRDELDDPSITGLSALARSRGVSEMRRASQRDR